MKISEIFSSIQGEGENVGYPMLFIRTSGCTRACSFCDTKYHTQGKEINKIDLVRLIKKSPLDIVCWTGGEPLLHRDEIQEIIKVTPEKSHQIETNGDLLIETDLQLFDYLAISPKEEATMKKVVKLLKKTNSLNDINVDIKVVTDIKTEGIWGLKNSTMLMPLTYQGKEKDKQIQKAVWEYCVKNNKRFAGRLQYYIFGKKKGI